MLSCWQAALLEMSQRINNEVFFFLFISNVSISLSFLNSFSFLKPMKCKVIIQREEGNGVENSLNSRMRQEKRF